MFELNETSSVSSRPGCLMTQSHRPTQYSSFLRFMLGLLVALLLFAEATSAHAVLQEDLSTTMSQFYHELELVAADSSGDLIQMLQDFVERYPRFERAYLHLLEHYIFTGQIQEAQTFFLQLAKERRHRRNSHWMLAKIFQHNKDPQAALQAFIVALQDSLQPGPKLLSDFLWFDNRHLKRYNDPEFVKQLNLDDKTRDIADAIHTFLKLDFRKATGRFERLPARASNDPNLLYTWGYCHRRQGHDEEARVLWQKGLEIARKQGDLESEAKFLLVLGNLYRSSQNPERVLCYFDSSYAIAKRINDLQNMEYLAGNRAIIYRERGDYALAEAFFRKAIATSRQLRSEWKLSVWYSHLGWLFHHNEQYDTALEYYDLSASFARKTNHEQMLLQALLNKARIYNSTGHTRLAEGFYDEVNTLAGSKGMVEYTRSAREGLADIYLAEGKVEKSRRIYHDLLSSPIHKHGYLANRAYWNIQTGRSHLAEYAYESARQSFQQAHKLSKVAQSDRLTVWSFIYLARMDLLAGRWTEAQKNYVQALEIARSEDNDSLPAIHLGLGNVYKARGERTKAITEYRKTARIVEKTRANLGVRQFRVAYFVAASEVYNQLIDCYYQWYLDSNQSALLDSLYYYVEMTRSRALRDLKLQKTANRKTRPAQQAVSSYEQVCQNLQVKQRKLREQTKQRTLSDSTSEKLLADIEISRLSLIEQRLRLAENSSADEVMQQQPQQALFDVRPQTTEFHHPVLLYHLSKSASFVLALVNGEKKLIQLPISASQARQAVNSLVAPLHRFTMQGFVQTPFHAKIAYELYQKLVEPVEAALNLPQNLVIVPDIDLMNLPFEMLLTRPADKSHYTPQDKPTYAPYFLQHRYAITYSPSSLLLESSSRWRMGRPGVLVFADPFEETPLLAQQQDESAASDRLAASYRPDDSGRSVRQLRLRAGLRLQGLPFAKVEAQKIDEIAPWAKIYQQTEATEAVFFREAARFDILHLATHGFVDSTYDAFSGLVLAAGPDSTEDGFLMGYEIAEMNLDCDLVTLSACETGRGKLVTGEGVLGLPRLFLSAGARSVLLTRWKVDDLFSAQLMPQFYRHLLQENRSKANALAEAKRAVLNEGHEQGGVYYQHPVFWAAFSLFGDPGQNKIDISNGLTVAKYFAVALFLLIGIRIYARRRPSAVS